jgi:hypothetical protein
MEFGISRRAARLAGAILLVGALALGACGSGGATPSPTPTGKAAVSPSPTSSAAGGSIRPLDGGGAPAPPSTPSTPAPVPPAVTEAFPGLPLDKIASMNYSPENKRLILITHLAGGDVAGGEAVCKAFIGVALFDPNASILVVATDYSPLATCSKN